MDQELQLRERRDNSPLFNLVLNQIPQHILAPIKAYLDYITEFLSPYWDANFYNGIAALNEGQDNNI